MSEYTSLEALRGTMPAYVLGALTPEERTDYERALRTPENASVMRGEFEACQATVNMLASAQPVEPPDGLFDRILTQVHAVMAQAAAAPPLETTAPTIDRRGGDRRRDDRRVDDGQHQPDEDRRQQERRHEGRRHDDTVEVHTPISAPVVRMSRNSRATRALTPLAMSGVEARSNTMPLVGWWTAGALFLVLVGVSYFAATTRRAHAELDTRLRENRVLLSRSEARLAERERLTVTLLGGRASVVLVNLRHPTTDAAAQFFWNAREGRAIINVFGLPPLPPDRSYQLWMLRDGVSTPIIEISPNEAGAVLVPGIEMPTSPTGVTQLFITNEPRSGKLAAPSEPQVLFGTVEARAALLVNSAPPPQNPAAAR
ncbi:MAG TPA: hypothetical protein DGD08_12915 [Gemmatimonas aurantiaca]|uniref:Regulator of SigK n=2 Tax=Gemmatimonas aurantiaca TaxID=173480 RepID=C1ABL4_GEMAT|nr:anti-sigma factor [Gemmatimonas aurantiaca]BAH39891.1 hypothetical protein GAU_2849 [Gemmatimonas aurantiaca T-27]HCT58098.1 hypothetical protein [Gemmatimonas aurantiaca]